MPLATLSAKIDPDLMAQIDALVGEGETKSQVVAELLKKALKGNCLPDAKSILATIDKSEPEELAGFREDRDSLISEITELEQAEKALSLKVSDAGKWVQLLPSGGDTLLDQVSAELAQLEAKEKSEAAIAAANEKLKGVKLLLKSKQAELQETESLIRRREKEHKAAIVHDQAVALQREAQELCWAFNRLLEARNRLDWSAWRSVYNFGGTIQTRWVSCGNPDRPTGFDVRVEGQRWH